jgi:predicted PurR-regulated permease PerM
VKKFGGDKRYLYWGVTAFAVIACCILLYMLIMHWVVFSTGVEKIFRILSPFIWGFVIAYLLRPMMAFFEKRLTGPLGGKLFPKRKHRAFIFGRLLALVFSEAFMVLIIFLLLRMVLPQLSASIESIVVNSPDYYDNIVAWAGRLLSNYPQLNDTVVSLVGNMSDSLVEWIKTTILPQMTNLVTNITSGVYYFIRGVYYVVIGVIVSVYILFNKEKVGTGAKKLIYSIFSLAFSKKILESARFSDGIFMGFIAGKIVDSAIIGVICYIGCALMEIQYAVLVAVIVGVTNIIPFFGPLIGAIPSAFIILIVSPIKSLEFIIFILLLQQFDGNILGPKILGESIGVNGFWVMFSIILGGGLFGFTGMLLGVPVFVVIYTGINHLIDKKLKGSGLPTETASYQNLYYFDPATNEPVYKSPETTPNERRTARSSARAAKKREEQKKEKDGEDGDGNA